MEAKTGITEENSKLVALELSKVLADEYVLYTKTRNAHWNVEGENFYYAHLFFEKMYQQLEVIIDDVAERIRAIGHYAPASLSFFLQLTHLTEKTMESNDSKGHIKDLLEDHMTIILHIRSNINLIADEYHDAGTCDFLTGLMGQHEKMAWMLRSHLK